MPGQILSERMFVADHSQLPVIKAALGAACELYPGFDEWLAKKVGKGLIDDTRRVIIYRERSSVQGVAIAKRTESERKLCTLWVARGSRSKKVATALAVEMFDWLETDRPLFTVPEERIEEFRSLLNNWRFGSYRKVHGLYRPEKHEYVFNGDPSHTASSEYIAQRASQMRGVEGCDLFELRA